MTLRTGHGDCKGTTRIEVLPADELPRGVPAPVAAPTAPILRKGHGEIADSISAKEAGRRGGLAKAKRLRMIEALGLKNLADTHAFRPYFLQAQDFIQAEIKAVARLAGGYCGPGPAALLQSAAYQLAASRYVYDIAVQALNIDMMGKASRLMNDSRQNRLAAHELAVREAQVRPKTDSLDAFMPQMAPEPEGLRIPGLPPPIDEPET